VWGGGRAGGGGEGEEADAEDVERVRPATWCVLLCAGRALDDTIVHMLVHVCDHYRFRVDWDDLLHHACSEVRALPSVRFMLCVCACGC